MSLKTIYLFICGYAEFSLLCQTFCSCGAWVSYCGGSACCRTWASGRVGSGVVVHRLSWPMACVIFPTRDQTHVPCIGRQILNPWTTREVPHIVPCMDNSGISVSETETDKNTGLCTQWRATLCSDLPLPRAGRLANQWVLSYVAHFSCTLPSAPSAPGNIFYAFPYQSFPSRPLASQQKSHSLGLIRGINGPLPSEQREAV